MKTLLQRAFERQESTGRKRNYRQYGNNVTDEEIELAIGWMTGKVGIVGVSAALGRDKLSSSGNSLYEIAQFLRAAYERGIIKTK